MMNRFFRGSRVAAAPKRRVWAPLSRAVLILALASPVACGDVTDTLRWDARVRYAENEVDYTLKTSINPSLGRLPSLRTVAGRSDGLVVVACDGPSMRPSGAFFVDASTDQAFGPAFTALVGTATAMPRLAPRVRSAAAMAAKR